MKNNKINIKPFAFVMNNLILLFLIVMFTFFRSYLCLCMLILWVLAELLSVVVLKKVVSFAECQISMDPGVIGRNEAVCVKLIVKNKWFLGQWEEREGGESIPIGGLAYYISPPRDLRDFIIEPLHSIIYVIFILLACGLFSKTWVELSGKSARDIAKSLRENQYFLEGIRENEENVYEQLNRTIPAAATLGGMCIGLLTIFADFMGAIGSGTGILLAVTIIYEYFEEMKKNENDKRISRMR